MKLFGHFIVGAILLLILSGCVKSPVMPTWDVNIDFPLLNEYLYVSDLVDSVNFFQQEGDVHFESTGSINSFLLNSLQIQPNTIVTVPLFANHVSHGAMSLASVVSSNQVKVAYGIVQSGTLLVQTTNIVSGFGSANILFDEFYTSNGQNLQIHITNSTPSINVNLAGLVIGTPTNTTIIDSLHYTVTNSSSLAPMTPIGEVNMYLNQILRFQNFIGLVDNYTLEVQNESTSIDIDYPLGIENAVQVNDASLTLQMMNEIGFECELHGKLFAYNDSTGVSRSIDILDDNGQPFVLDAATSVTEPNPSTFILHNGLNELTSIIPTRFAIGEAYFVMRNDTSGFGFASVGQRVTGTYIEKVPFNFTLYDALITPQRLDSLEITVENRDRIRNNLNEATLVLKVKNQLPIGLDSLKIIFSSNPDVFGNQELIRTATINSGGYDSQYQEVVFHLNRDELLIFDKEKIYFKTRIYLRHTDGPVIVHGSSADYVQVIGRIKMNATVEGK